MIEIILEWMVVYSVGLALTVSTVVLGVIMFTLIKSLLHKGG